MKTGAAPPASEGRQLVVMRGSMTIGRAVGMALAVATWLTSSSARAEPPAPSAPTKSLEDTIRRTADPCFDGIEASVRKWLERDRVDARIAVVVEGRAGEEVVVVIRRDGVIVGERRLQTSALSCDRARETVSLAVAMAIDATLLKLRSTDAPEGPVTPPAVPADPTATDSSPHGMNRVAARGVPKQRSKQAPSSSVRVGLGLEERVWLAALPRAAVGSGPYLSIERGALRPRLAASFTLPVDIPFTDPAGAGARVFAVAGEADACALARARTISMGPCARMGAGGWTGIGRGLARAESTTVPWVFVGGALMAAWQLAARWELVGHAGLLRAIIRPALTVGKAGGRLEQTTVMPELGASFGIGLHYAL